MLIALRMEEIPTTDDTNGNRRVTIVLSAADASRLDAIAATKRTTITAVVREIVGAELDRQLVDA